MKINDLIIDSARTLGNTLILAGIAPRYVYDGSGHRTHEVRGYYYHCVCPDRGYMPVRVAIDGPRMIDAATLAGNPLVRLDTPVIKLYYAGGEYRVAISANGIRVSNKS